jgi:hypothetical protein
MASRPEPQGVLATEDRKRCGSTADAFRGPAELNRRLGWLAARPAYERRAGVRTSSRTRLDLGGAGGGGDSAAAGDPAGGLLGWAGVPGPRGAHGSTRARRQGLERISDQLRGLELRLSYSVKASADFGLLVLSMRAESFDQALYESMGLAGRAAAAARMQGAARGGDQRRADSDRERRAADR